jgi:glucuronate isomerase
MTRKNTQINGNIKLIKEENVMRQFMDDNFLLMNDTAIKLYHDYAKEMPIYDYHCHLSPKEIAENKSYKNITEIWLGGDHYKWRAMRSNGIDEYYVTGDASDKEKFIKWAETIEKCIGNPLYHWTHLELKRYFGIEKILGVDTAEEIWEECNRLLATEDFTARQLIKRSNVNVICTTDDPTDSLKYHLSIAEDTNFNVKVLPTFRPDKSFNIDKKGFTEWIKKLSEVVEYKIDDIQSLKRALVERIDFFHEVGCRISDHALDTVVYSECTDEEADKILKKALKDEQLQKEEVSKFKTNILTYLGEQYYERGWTMQIHIGAQRNNNTKMFNILGPDTGFDSIADEILAYPLARLLDGLDIKSKLPKTILYCLNPRDNEVIGTMIGNFQGSEVSGKIQFGSAWWFNDQKDGMERQIVALGNLGMLSNFVGMLTDSRSFLSYTRHEYFRRILCNIFGVWVENGEFPRDMNLLGNIVKDICYNNAEKYFGI